MLPHKELLSAWTYFLSAKARWSGYPAKDRVHSCLLAESIQFDVECQIDGVAFAVIDGPPEVF